MQHGSPDGVALGPVTAPIRSGPCWRLSTSGSVRRNL